MPTCALQAHVAALSSQVKYFAWDDAKNAKLEARRGIGFEDVVLHIERGDLLDPGTPHPDGGERSKIGKSCSYELEGTAASAARVRAGERQRV